MYDYKQFPLHTNLFNRSIRNEANDNASNDMNIHAASNDTNINSNDEDILVQVDGGERIDDSVLEENSPEPIESPFNKRTKLTSSKSIESDNSGEYVGDDGSSKAKDDVDMEIEIEESNMKGIKKDVSTNATSVTSFGFSPTIWMGFALGIKTSIASGQGCTIAEFERKYLSLGCAANNSESTAQRPADR